MVDVQEDLVISREGEIAAIYRKQIRPLEEEIRRDGVLIDSVSNEGEWVTGKVRLRTSSGSFSFILDVLGGGIEIKDALTDSGYITHISSIGGRKDWPYDEAWAPVWEWMLKRIRLDRDGASTEVVKEVIKKRICWGYPILGASECFVDLRRWVEGVGEIGHQEVDLEIPLSAGKSAGLANMAKSTRLIERMGIITGSCRLSLEKVDGLFLEEGECQLVCLSMDDRGIREVSLRSLAKEHETVWRWNSERQSLKIFLCKNEIAPFLKKFITPEFPKV